MTKKATKRALLSSALALVVCVSMLIGTTYAWFTDSVTSTNNIIKSGNLDVELYWSTDAKTWNAVDSNTNIFTDELWEPGHTEVVYLKVVNEGTLALKYNLGVNVASETKSVSVLGNELALSDYIKYAVIKGANSYDRDAAVLAAEANNATALKSAYNSGIVTLESKDEKIVTMVVYMPTTVGNEANYAKGETVPTIKLGINLLATQVEFENDSFGDDYDEDAIFGTYIELNAGDDLLAAMASAEKDVPLTIKLNGNVEWPTEGHHGENDITPASSIVIDGNGNTITAIGSGVTPLGDKEAPMTLKNVKIVDNSVSYAENS